MKKSIKGLKGSPYRDAFKKWHKEFGPKWAYAIDMDMAFIVFNKTNSIPAIIDYKTPRDKVTDTEKEAYDYFVDKKDIPVYLVIIHGDFDINKCHYCGKKDVRITDDNIDFITVENYDEDEKEEMSIKEYWKWESNIRN